MSQLNLTKQLISNIESHRIGTEYKRNLILSILKSTASKRETKNYLNKYQNQFAYGGSDKNYQRNLFVDRYLNNRNPFGNIYDEDENKLNKIPLRVAIFKLNYQSIKPRYWKGIQETFKRLINLGISPIVLMDYDFLNDKSSGNFRNNELLTINEGNRILNNFKDVNPRLVRNIFKIKDGKLFLHDLQQLIIPLYQEFVPIVQPIITEIDSSNQFFAQSNDLLKTLCESLLSTKNILSIEKIVIIDKNGGIPSIERNQTSHVFINLSQEYSDLVSELYIGFLEPSKRDFHLNNLSTVNDVLTTINKLTGNDEATAIITTPYITSINNDQLNPIIYNVLTDRPIISSSLPTTFERTPTLSTSILKKGMKVEVLEPENYGKKFTLQNLIDDGLVDKTKLFDLIEDSFGRKVDMENYMKRIDETIATVIIIGDYDGGAIITKEQYEDQSVTYLDKFAIAKRNQGLPGMADIIFKLIVQSNPDELIWRSRNNNPVNKWYFERSIGSMATGSQWKIFYTGDIFNKSINTKKRRDHVNISEKLKIYSAICENIPPSFI